LWRTSLFERVPEFVQAAAATPHHEFSVSGVKLPQLFQSRQLPDRAAALGFRQPQLVQVLKIQPELWTRPEKMGQTQRRVTSDRTLAVEDRRDAVGGHVETSSELGSTHPEFLEFLPQMFARMDRLSRHVLLLNDGQR
jgi:hypothetical protein